MSRNSFSPLKVQSSGHESGGSRGLPHATQMYSHTRARQRAQGPRAFMLPPAPHMNTGGLAKIYSYGTPIFVDQTGRLNWGGGVLKVMGSWLQGGGRWAGSPQKVMADCVSGRPIPTARFLKLAHVTTWLALCSSTQRGNGGGARYDTGGAPAYCGGHLGCHTGAWLPFQVFPRAFAFNSTPGVPVSPALERARPGGQSSLGEERGPPSPPYLRTYPSSAAI